MKSGRFLTSLFLLSMILSGCSIVGSGGSDYLVRGELGLINFEPDGDFALGTTAAVPLPGQDVTLANLGLDDDESALQGKASVRFGSNEISLSGFAQDWEGTGTIPVSFGDITAGVAVGSTLDITNLKLLYRWFLVDMDMISVGPGIGIDYFDLKAEVAGAGLVEEVDGQAPVPMPGISAVARLGDFRAYADLYGISLNVGDADGTVLDFEGGVKYSPLDYFDLFVGYRYINIELGGEDSSQEFDVSYTLPGLYFGGGFRF